VLLGSGGGVHCWGDNYSGEFGLGSTTPVDTTATLPSAYGNAVLGRAATSISVGVGFSCSRLNDGEVVCWGDNGSGQLGLGNANTIGDDETPSPSGLVSLGTTSVTSIVTGSQHTCVLLGGTAGMKCWGTNAKGQLGYGDKTTRGISNQPVGLPAISLPSGVTASSIYLGISDTCVLLSDGSVRCWGWNKNGQLGLGYVSSGATDFVGGLSNETPSQLPALRIFQ
jgi:alpha-tubulin suppressor-like RCC1 family protein